VARSKTQLLNKPTSVQPISRNYSYVQTHSAGAPLQYATEIC
jgi:hypothetical protein